MARSGESPVASRARCFANGGEFDAVLTEAARIPAGGPIGDLLPAVLAFVRAVVFSYVVRLTAESAAYSLHERLVASHPELLARSVTKQRQYAEVLRDLLAGEGATARPRIGLAAYYAGPDDDHPR